MSEAVLVLIGGATPRDSIGWALVSSADGAIEQRGMVEHGASAPPMAPARTVLVLPGADAQVKRLDLPARTEAQAVAGAALQFEGALAAAADVHYAVGDAIDAEGRRLAAAIARARLAEWLERCRAAGADPRYVYLDFTIWPVAPGEVEVMTSPARAIIAAGPAGGFAIEPELAPSVFARWLTQLPDAITQVRVSGAAPSDWAARIGPSGPPVSEGGETDPFAVLARAGAAAPDYAPNLRQGAFAPAAQSAPPWRIWRFAAALAVLALLLQVFYQVMAGVSDRQAAEKIMAQAESDFRAARPDVRRVANLRAQVAALVNAMDQSRNHPVLAATDPLLAVLETQSLVRLDELQHHGPGRQLRITLSAPQAQLLDPAVEALRQQGLAVEVSAQGPRGDRFVTELVLQSP